MRFLGLLSLAVAAVLVVQETQARDSFRLPISLPPATDTPPTLISCDNVLVQGKPDDYPHCHCVFGPWSAYRFSSYGISSNCTSGQNYVLESTRTRLSSKCTQQPMTEKRTKDVCEPTLAEKAQMFIESLGLGDRSKGSIVSIKTGVTKVIVKDNTTTTIAVQKRQAGSGLTVTCPASQNEKAVCTDITGTCYRGRRSITRPQGMERLADFIQQQDHMYSNKVEKRKAGDTSVTDRNVFFVVDSSGSIPQSVYTRVLDILANLASLLCGDVAIGMFSYSRGIELEFCPTCFRSSDYTAYINEVTTRIRSARHHRSSTYTGEMVKCLRQHVLPSPTCRLLNKKTQIVFFTDGRANGCTSVPPAIAELESVYPNLEVYAIGMGNILQTGILDLLTVNYDPGNIFNVEDIDQLEGLYDQILQLIQGDQIQCSPVSFGK